MMTREQSTPESSSQAGLEIAGALQAIYQDVPNRDFVPDIQQDAALQALGSALVHGEISGYVEMATGTGKTLLEALVAEAGVRAGKRVLVLAPSIQVANQITGVDGKTGLGRFTGLHAEGAVQQHYGSRRANADSPLVVSTYSGFLREAKSTTRPLGNFGLIVGDECHRSLGPGTSQALVDYMPGAVKLGFSATPDYADDRKSEEVYGTSLFEFSLRSAIESGFTAPVNALIIETGTTLEVSEYRKDFSEAELAPLIANMDRNGVAIRLAADLVRQGRQGIIACVPGGQNAHTRLLANLLQATSIGDRNIVAADIGSHLSEDEQRQRLHAFHEGAIDVLTFTRTLEEGWDSDRASFCLNLSPTTSPVRTRQLLGRILRRKLENLASIYADFVDEKVGISREQYTAMHALDLITVDMHRTLGRYHSENTKAHQPALDISRLLSPDIQNLLQKSQGKTLQEVLVTHSRLDSDPLLAFWERRLAKEGMPAELPYNPVLPSELAAKVSRAVAQLAMDFEAEMDIEQVIESAGVNQAQAQAMREFGLRVDWDDEALAAMPDPGESVEEKIGDMIIRQTLRELLSHWDFRSELSSRQIQVTVMYYGFGDREAMTFKQIGEELDISNSTAGKDLREVTSHLRSPRGGDKLGGYDTETYKDERNLPPSLSAPLLSQDFRGILQTTSKDIEGTALHIALRRRQTPLRKLYPTYFPDYPYNNPRQTLHIVRGQFARAIQALKLTQEITANNPPHSLRARELRAKVIALTSRTDELSSLYRLLLHFYPETEKRIEEQRKYMPLF